MSASLQEHDYPTISSSGLADGLGRRVLAFDRESGVLTEHLHLRPELAAFEAGIQARLDALATLTDTRFATPGSVVRSGGDLTVISEFVSGSRLADLLDLAQEQGLVPGIDAALGYLIDALEGLAALHGACGVPHGLIAPSRTMLTLDGRVVFLDPLYAAVVERLGLSPARLWKDFGVAVLGRAKGVRLDPTADVAQVALGTVTLVLGRNLDECEFPGALPSLVDDVFDVAQIRASAEFAAAFRRFLHKALPHSGSAFYPDATAALADVRSLIEPELNVDTCRRALAEFVAQTGDVSATPGFDDDTLVDDAVVDESTGVPDRDAEPAAESPFAPPPVRQSDDLALRTSPADDGSPQEDADAEAEALRALLERGALDDGPGPAPVEEPAVASAADETLDVPAEDDDVEFEIHLKSPSRTTRPSVGSPAGDDEDGGNDFVEEEDGEEEEDEAPPNIFDLSTTVDTTMMDRFGFGFKMPPKPEPKPIVVPEAPETPAGEPTTVPDAAAPDSPPEPVGSSVRSRRKKQEKKSARARKDKLRSTVARPEPLKVLTDPDEPAATGLAKAAPRPAETTPETPAAATAPTPPAPAAAAAPAAPPEPAKGGWLVPPDKAAHFEPVTSAATTMPVFAPPPPPTRPLATAPSLPGVVPMPGATPPPQPVFQPPPPVFQAPPAPAFPSPAAQPRFTPPAPAARPPVATPTPAADTPPALSVGSVSKLPTLKMKNSPPQGFTPKRPRPRPPVPSPSAPPVISLGYPVAAETDSAGRGFPKKLAIALLVIVATAIGAGRYLIADRQAADAAVDTAADLSAAAAAAKPAAATTGTVNAQSQPSGARVLLDDRDVGRTPVSIKDVQPGRHTLTFRSTSGSVSRQIRVVAGEALDMDVPLFSGWVAIYAPVVLNVSESGKALGTTEDGRLMLPPGRHRLTLTNTSLGYRSVENVDVEAGETATLRLEPTGDANLNATPWAEVWIDGRKLGDTPMGKVALPLGNRELVFKNPQYGERKVNVVIRGNQSTPVTVDFTK